MKRSTYDVIRNSLSIEEYASSKSQSGTVSKPILNPKLSLMGCHNMTRVLMPFISDIIFNGDVLMAYPGGK